MGLLKEAQKRGGQGEETGTGSRPGRELTLCKAVANFWVRETSKGSAELLRLPNQEQAGYKAISLLKNPQTTNAGEGVEKREPSYPVDGNINWCSYYGKQCGGASKKKKKLKTELLLIQ